MPRSWSRPSCGIAAIALALAMIAAIAPVRVAAAVTTVAATGTIEVAFTPGDAIDARIVAAIATAEREVLVLAYSFTHPKIARALSEARARGVDVEIVADREESEELPQSAIPALARDGVPVWLDGNYAAAHNKVMIIDADGPHAITITGSYNYTLAAQRRNAENVVILRDNPDVARAYRANFRRLQAKATRWSGHGAIAPHPSRRPR